MILTKETYLRATLEFEHKLVWRGHKESFKRKLKEVKGNYFKRLPL